MKLTEAKLKQLILEIMEEPLPEMITDLLGTNDPENVVYAIELFQGLSDPDNKDEIEVTIISPTSVSISGNSLGAVGKLFKRLGLKAGHGGLVGDDGRPFITADLYPDEPEPEEQGGEDAPYDDGSGEWKSNVRSKR